MEAGSTQAAASGSLLAPRGALCLHRLSEKQHGSFAVFQTLLRVSEPRSPDLSLGPYSHQVMYAWHDFTCLSTTNSA